MVTHIFRVIALVFAALVLTAGPAAADCIEIPPPNTPNVGSWGGGIDERPYPMFNDMPTDAEDVAGPNPFTDAETTIYHEYGWGSWKVHNYDPPDQGVAGCADNRVITSWPRIAANIMLGLMTVAGAAAVFLVRLVFDPASMAIFEPIMRLFTDVVGNRLFIPLFPIAVVLTGLTVIFWARKGDMKDAGKTAFGSIGITVIAVACVTYGLVIAPAIDKVVTGALAAVGEAVTNPIDESAATMPGGNYRGEPMSLPDSIAANLTEAVMYPTWCSAQLGSGANQAALDQCDELFIASTYSRTEAAAVKLNPELAADIADRKEDAYRDAAKAIKKADSNAYEHLTGGRAADRIAPTILGLAAMGLAVVVLGYAMFRLFISLLMVRLGIALFPLAAIAAQHPHYRWIAARAGDGIWTGVLNAAIFGAVGILWIAAGIGGILSPEHGLPLILALALLAAGTWGVWKIANRYQILPEWASLKREERQQKREAREARRAAREARQQDRAQEWDSTPPPTDPTDPPPEHLPPAEQTHPRKSLVIGAGKGMARQAVTAAVVTVASGGTGTGVSAGVLAAGAARGAVETHRQNKEAKTRAAEEQRRQQQQQSYAQMPYYPAHRASRPQAESKLSTPLPPGNPSRSRELPPGASQASLPAEARTRAGRTSTNPSNGVVIYHPKSTSESRPVTDRPRQRPVYEITNLKTVPTGGSSK